MARAEHRILLDSLCPHPDLGWLTTYRILRLASQPGSIERRAAAELRRAITSLTEDPNGPTGCRYIYYFFNMLNMPDSAAQAHLCYLAARNYIRQDPRTLLESHLTPTRTFHPEICIPAEN